MPASASSWRAKVMFWPVLAAYGSTRIASSGTPQAQGVLAVVDRLAAREAGPGGGTVAAAEDHDREDAGTVEAGGRGGHPEVVAAQADRRRTRPRLVAHLVVVPDQRRVVELLVAELALLALGHWHSLTGPRWALRMPPPAPPDRGRTAHHCGSPHPTEGCARTRCPTEPAASASRPYRWYPRCRCSTPLRAMRGQMPRRRSHRRRWS
jgi:hypothetical protein